MKARLGLALLGGGAAGVIAAAALTPVTGAPVQASNRCEALTGRSVDSGSIDKAVLVRPGESIITEEGKPGLPAPTAFCRAFATLKPTQQSSIKVEVWLPEHGVWNGKLLGAGNGGYGGSMTLPALTMRGGLAKGYAATGSDMGHALTADVDASWALNQPEKIKDWGYRANHLAAIVAKQVVAAYYATPLGAAYFQGCSDGGREALIEAQHYPKDYDAIIAGAPANAWTSLMRAFMADREAVFGRPESAIPDAKLKLLQNTALAMCDAKDGVTDGVIDDPRQCRFDPAVLQCKAGDGPACLTAAQVATARALYRGPVDREGRSLYPGFQTGGEAVAGAWDLWLTGPAAQHGRFGTEFFRNMVHSNAAWQATDYDPVRDPVLARRMYANILDADNPDLAAFYGHGGKLILYHGWSDAALAPGGTVNYYRALQRAHPRETASSVRLFMVPGMSHCLGGPGANVFDPLSALDGWKKGGPAPERLVATRFDNPFFGYLGLPAKPLGTRPLCAYPKVARWNGKGSTDDAANFACVAPS